MIKKRWFLFLSVLFGLFTSAAIGQVSNANKFTFYAKLTDLKTGDKLENVFVDVYEYGEQIEHISTDNSGKFKTSFAFNSEFRIEFLKNGYVTKIVEINTQNVPLSFQNFGAEYGGWTITMFKAFDNIDYDVLKNPIARVYFDTEYNQFDYDRDLARAVVKKMDKLADIVIEEEENRALALKNLEEDYKDLLKDGDKAFSDGEWHTAQAFFQKAVELKPKENYPQNKLNEIDERLTSQKALEEKYKGVITAADQLMAMESYNEAKVKYQEALLLKPKMEYPKQMISEVDQKLNQLAAEEKALAQAQAKKQADFNSSFDAATNFLETGNLDQAKLSANQALNIFPDDVRAKNLLAEIEDNIAAKEASRAAELMAQKEAEAQKLEEEHKMAEKINAIITEAEELKLKGELQLAKARYQEAKTFGRNTESIDSKINEIENLIAGEVRKDQEYSRQINLVQILIDKKDYEYALTKLDQLKLEYPDKSQTQEKIDFINGILEKQKAQDLAQAQREEDAKRKEEELKQKQFLALVDAGDGLMANGLYEQALAKYKQAERVDPAAPLIAQKLNMVQQKIDQKLALLAQEKEVEKKQATNKKINIEDDPEEYTEEFLNEIAKEYPEGVTEVVYQKGNKTITKRIVVKGGIGTVYRKVRHNWGGEYFFRNNDPITKFIWDKETVF